MATKQTIRELLVDELQLGFINLVCVVTDNDTVTCASLRDKIGDTDNRLIEGGYLYLRSSDQTTQAYNTAVTLNGAITATATEIVYSQATATVYPERGDVIIIGTEYILITDNDISRKTLTVIRGVKNTTAATHADGAAVNYTTDWQYRTISSHTFSTNAIELTRVLKTTTAFSNKNGFIDIYLILSPQELDACINRAHNELWTKSRDSITLDTTNNRYDLTTTITHLTDPALLIDMWYRRTDSGSTTAGVREYPVANRRVEWDEDTLFVTLYDIPSDADNWTLIVESRKYYSDMSLDEETTTCPLPLIKAYAKVKVLEKIFNKLGAAAKGNYGAELAHAREEREKMYLRYKQAITPINFNTDEPFYPPKVPISSVEWRGGWYE